MVAARYIPHAGGIEVHVNEVGRRLVARGFTVEVLTVRSDARSPDTEERDGMAVRRFRQVTLGPDLYIAPELTAHLRRIDYDLVHLQGVHTLLAPEVLLEATKARAKNKVPTVVTFHTGGHSSALRHRLRGLQWRAMTPLLKRAGGLVAVSRHEAETFSRILGDSRHIELIPNGADPLPVGDLDPSIRPASPLVVSLGRLERYKGHHRMISAMPLLLERHPAAGLVVVGHGPAEGALRRQVGRLGLTDRVQFVSFGPSERARLGALLVASNVVVLLSSYESHPVAAMEAAGLSRPLVVTDHSGLHELVGAGLATGVRLQAGSEEIAEAVAQAWLAGGEARIEGAMATALPRWDECVDQLAVLYSRLLSQSGSDFQTL